jgi:hypothetical protein
MTGNVTRPENKAPGSLAQVRIGNGAETSHAGNMRRFSPKEGCRRTFIRHTFTMDQLEATTPELGTAHRVIGPSLCTVDSTTSVFVDLKRFLRLFIFLGTVLLSIVLGYKIASLIGSAVTEAGAQIHWFNVVGGHINPKSLLRH